MAQINFKAFMERNKQGNGGETKSPVAPKVSYFSLKNDKDEAIVRFMLDSEEDFDIIVAHQVKIGGYNRAVNCIRSAYEDESKCPLCDEGYPVKFKFYIKLVEYVTNEDGSVSAIPKIWERSSAYINTMNDLLQEYGPLSDNLFKIKRSGVAGSKDTSYSIMITNQSNYPADAYAKRPELFKGYKVLGAAVINKNYEGLQELVAELEKDKDEDTKKAIPTASIVAKKSVSEDDMPWKEDIQPTVAPPREEVTFDTASKTAPTVAAETPRHTNMVPPTLNGFGRPRRFY